MEMMRKWVSLISLTLVNIDDTIYNCNIPHIKMDVGIGSIAVLINMFR